MRVRHVVVSVMTASELIDTNVRVLTLSTELARMYVKETVEGTTGSGVEAFQLEEML
jgi:hypothetical protein